MKSDDESYQKKVKPLYIKLQVKHQLCFFNKPIYKHIIADRLPRILKAHNMSLHAWCLMSDQLLMVISKESLDKQQAFVSDFCFETSQDCYRILKNHESDDNNKINELLKQTDSLSFHKNIWQSDYKKIVLNNDTEAVEKINDIHRKPVITEYVIAPKHYLYSSACNYQGIQGLIPIDKLN